MSAASELQAAARTIRAHQPPEATFHRAVAKLLDLLAIAATKDEINPAIVRAAKDACLAYRNPGGMVSRSITRGAR